MFPIDSLPVAYYEEREAAEIAKRLDIIRQQQSKAQAAVMPVQQSQRMSQQSCLPTPPISRPASTTVLGNIYQGFVRAASPGKCPSSGMITPEQTLRTKARTSDESEVMLAEKRRDADIVGFRAW